MRRWFTVSSLFLQRQHQLTRVRPCLLRLSIVRILSKAIVQTKKGKRGGALTFQTIFQGKGKTLQIVMYYYSSSLQTCNYVLGTITFYVSLGEVFEEYKRSRNATKESSFQSSTSLTKLGFQRTYEWEDSK
jgi:hypothetical protein